MIPRLHLFELEDQSWFPREIRDFATDYLHFIETKFSLHRAAVGVVGEALRASGAARIVDLCSGGAGPIPLLLRDLEATGQTVSATLTDKFPNLDAFERAARNSGNRIIFREESIDAVCVPADLQGLRTLFNSFHHFPEADATRVLLDAVHARQAIAALEIPERGLRTILPMLFFTPAMVAMATLFIRPFSWRRLLWTYLVPLVPLTCWWDGLVSQFRAYTPDELSELAGGVGTTDYCWRAGKVPLGSTPGVLTYLIGWPKK